MIVETRLIPPGFAGFTVWPFIFVCHGSRDDAGLIGHELVHFAEQRRCLTIPWLAAYLISKRFRCKSEVRAYRRQIAMGCIGVHDAAASLMKYRLGITYPEALALLD